MGSADLLDRAAGALVGLAVGDALGTTVEFQRPGSFEPLTEIVGGGPFGLAPGRWTDDTSLALALAESVLDTGGHDPRDQLRRYLRWYREGEWSSTGRCFDIGAATMAAIHRFESAGTVIDDDVDQDAAANGSLMRLAGVPVRWHAEVAQAAEWSGRSSMPTHPARRPVDACRVLGAMVAALVAGRPADEVLAPDFWSYGPLHPEIEAVARGSWLVKEPPAIRGTGYCVDALEAALWAVGGAADFADAVRRAANLGDDADTTAAIAGQLAGARWGRAGIPERWRAVLHREAHLAALGRSLAIAGGAEVPQTGAHAPVWYDDALVHAWWVRPGRVLAGELPGHPIAERMRDMVDVLVDAGVRTFVDLTTRRGEPARYDATMEAVAAARGVALERCSFPIPDMGILDDYGYDAIVDAIDDASQHGVVYVHCIEGIGRTGTVAGCLLVDDGLDGDEALERIASLRAGTRKAIAAAPQTFQQCEVVRRWVEWRRGET